MELGAKYPATVTSLPVPTSFEANTADGVPVTEKLSPATKPK